MHRTLPATQVAVHRTLSFSQGAGRRGLGPAAAQGGFAFHHGLPERAPLRRRQSLAEREGGKPTLGGGFFTAQVGCRRRDQHLSI